MADERKELAGYRPSIIEAITLAAIVSTLIAVAYLVSYWGSFSINIFQYIAAQDILVMAAYPLSVLAAIMIGVSLLVQSIVDVLPKQTPRPPRAMPLTRRGRAVVFLSVLALFITAVIVGFRFSNEDPDRWLLLLLLVVPLLVFIALHATDPTIAKHFIATTTGVRNCDVNPENSTV